MFVCHRFRFSFKHFRWFSFLLFLYLSLPVTYSVAGENLNYMVIEEQAAPFQIKDDSERSSGIISDFLFKILDNSPHQIQVNSFPFKRMVKVINAGLYPNWITYGSSKWSAPQNLNLSDCSILTVKHVLLSPKENKLNFNGIDSLLGKRIVLLFGFEYPQLDKYMKTEEILELRVKKYDSAFKALELERGIGFVEMESRIKYNLKQAGRKIEDYDLIDLTSIIPRYDIRFSLAPNMPESIKTYIDDQCKQLKHSGELERIVNRYLD